MSLFQKMTPRKKNNKKSEQEDDTEKELSAHSIEDTENTHGQSVTSVGSNHSNPSPCGQCSKLVKNEDFAMECEICDQWFNIKCQSITKAEYNYIKGGSKKKSLSKMHWYCHTCYRMAANFMKTMTNLHAKQEKIEGRIGSLEEKINEKVDKEEIKQLKEDLKQIKEGQKKTAEEQEKKIQEITSHKTDGISWADIVSKEEVSKNVEDTIEKRLKEKEDEEKARRDRMKNIIVYGIKEAKGSNQLDRQTEDINQLQKIFWEYCEVNLGEEHVGKVIHLGKFDETKKRPILVSIKIEDKKRELFQNLHKLRRAADNISITHDLTKKQREEATGTDKRSKKKRGK